jgi:hypothetical protein
MKALLVVWIGLGNTQSVTVTVMDSLAECEAAIAALEAAPKWSRLADDAMCVPYAAH